MIDKILETAKNDDRVRAVYMNGSRANPNVAEDEYRDYDIVFIVTETQSFIDNPDWINVFGDIAIIQEPNMNDMAFGAEFDLTDSYAWLMLFKNHKRIDLTIEVNNYYGEDKLTIPLLDKDGLFHEIPPPSEEDNYVVSPIEAQYVSVCNNFWWCLNNVGKGIMRDQLPYVMWMYNSVVRDELNRMVDWYIGTLHDFKVNVGMAGKYYKKYLSENLYTMLKATYSDSDYNNIWESIFTACDLFHIIAIEVAGHFGYIYNYSEETAIRNYLNSLHSSWVSE